MPKLHIKRIAAPRSWPINRKSSRWIYRPNPGAHAKEDSMALGTIMKEILGVAKTDKDVKYILSTRKVKINGKIRKDQKFSVGLMDVISYDNKNYRILFNYKGRLTLIPISEDESRIILRKIVGKRFLKGKKIQISFLDSTNLILDKKDLKVSDTLVFENEKIKDHLKLEKGAVVYIIKGSQVGKVGIVEEIKEEKSLNPSKIVFLKDKIKLETIKQYAFVIGKNKSLITVPNE